MTEELRDVENVDSQGFGCDNDNYLWIFILLIILFCCCSGGIGGIFDGFGCGCNDWIWILIVIGVLFYCCSGSGGIGNLFGCF